MELMESRWTDDRMDDLKHQVDELGRGMDAGFTEQRREMNARFDRMEKRFDKIDARFEASDRKFDARFEASDRKFDARFEASGRKFDARFETVDAKFEAVTDQIARTQEMVIGLNTTLTRFSLGFFGAAVIAVLAAVLAS
jgi:hypothetical protein